MKAKVFTGITKVWSVLLVLGSLNSFSQNLQISGGNTFSTALCSNGAVYSWGQNNSGQLGQGAAGANSSTPIQVINADNPSGSNLLPPIRLIDAGSGSHTIALDCNTQVWTWGANGQNQLGRSTAVTCGTAAAHDGLPRRVVGIGGTGFLSNVKTISGATDASYAVLTTGEVVAWGDNSNSELGRGASGACTNIPDYVKINATTNLTGIVQIEGGDFCAYALDASGNVWSWGSNGNNALGRPATAYAGRVVDATGTPLSNIVQLSAGDTHGMALDANGNVWTWGGDWGPGQLGQGANFQSNNYASKVVEVNGACTMNDQYAVGPYLTGVKYIAASQASSAAVLADGTVAAWGANGLYDAAVANEGTLGRGNLAAGHAGSECPKRVRTNATDSLTNIVSISDGDAWFFAINTSGQVYVWGYNLQGELGLNNTTNQGYATANTLIPTTCGGSLLACPIASLGADRLKCAGTSVILNAGAEGTSYTYTWYSGSSATGPWTQIGAADLPYPGGANLTVTTAQYYRVVIKDTRAYVADKCGPCTQSEDVVRVEDRVPPAAIGAAGTCGSSVCFQISSTGAIDNNAFDWYATSTSTPALNTTGPQNPFCAPSSSLTLNGSDYEIWVDDKRQFLANVGPTSQPCAGAVSTDNANKYQQLIVVYRDVTLSDLKFWQESYSTGGNDTYHLRVYGHDPTKNSNQGGPSNTLLATSENNTYPQVGSTPTLRTLNITSASPTAGSPFVLTGSTSGTKYWIELNGSGKAGKFTCAASYPYSDNVVGEDLITMNAATENGNNITTANYNGTMYDVNFKYSSGYPCGRFKVTASNSSTACLPVEFISFTATKNGEQVTLDWVTGAEVNSSHFLVLKSTDGIHWNEIGNVAAAGFSTQPVYYTFNDPNVTPGVVYYKLAQYDSDGSVAYSNVVSIDNSFNLNLVVQPNPGNGNFQVSFSAIENSEVIIAISTVAGQDILQEKHVASSAVFTKEFKLEGIASGIYFLSCQSGGMKTVQKLIVE